ncbi:MAG: ATP-dependent DNA helicase RecG [Calditrichaeota bacterium]|nr:MAG: ATP-dependent DNA helicase RecG [Calditrichota bacterium]
MQIVHPDMERLEDESDKMIHAGRIIPVYPQTVELNKVGLNSKSMRRITDFIFEHLNDKIEDILPVDYTTHEKLLSLNDALRMIHYPETREDIEKSRKRLAFDELLYFQSMVFLRKSRKDKKRKNHAYGKPISELEKLHTELPFELTSGQQKSLTEIIEDLQKPAPMLRMLQGDVGCGKTIVAVSAGFYAAIHNLQTAFMAPTEILAEQHYRNWKDILAGFGVETGLLTSSLKKKEKDVVLKRCADGEIDILFGTHALIYDAVSFSKLGLVIIDEQHRFGVEQRGKLYAKGDNPDLLVMTATPIPRTLALTLYGDLDISTIDTLPSNRKPIKTVWRTKDVRAKVYTYILDEIKKGGQVYIVYPLIEKSELIELENVEDAYKELSETFFKNVKTAVVHGKVKPKERDEILREFFDGSIDILFATTVIEVGLDNPNATIMVIEHAERFGLAQLHQLRGRIGRGAKQATMVAIAHPPLSDISHERLEYFVSTTDGFKIAEADLKLRGPGELFGLRQSGDMRFQNVRIGEDQELIQKSRSLLEKLFEKTEKLDISYKKLYTYLIEKVSKKEIDIDGG